MATTKATRDVIDLATRPITNLQCTGGNINGTTIGNVTPAAGYFTNLNASSIVVTTTLNVTGATIIGTIYAYYAADIAELYTSDQPYEPGTLVQIGGSKEITIASNKSEVFGVISTKPAYVLNAEGASIPKDKLPVAMVGRVPVRVIGPVSKGQRLVLSDTPGVAIGLVGPHDRTVVGRSLVTSAGPEERLVEAAVLISL